MDLKNYSPKGFDRGKSRIVEAFWIALRGIFFSQLVPSSAPRVWLLRRFGAVIGTGAIIKPGIKIKFPWRLTVEDHVWLGEDVWIDNLDEVAIGSNSCISQGAYLCTGSHDWSRRNFDLITKPIRIGSGVWIAAKAVVGPGVIVGDNAVVTMGSVVTRNVPPCVIFSGEGIRIRSNSSEIE